MSKIALGTWAWGAGAFGGDTVFGSKTDVENLKPVFDAAMKAGLNLWDTATAYGMGESEKFLGSLAKGYKREDVLVSTKFTPQIAEMYDNNVEKMADASIARMECGYIDIYWIHNPMDVERWTPGLIPLLKSGKVRRVGVSNHNIKEIKRANEILGEAGFKVSAVQNHFSLLYRSSEKGGVLDYCKDNGIEFWAYMVLEQGALSGKYNKENPLPEESDRGKKYNPVLPQLEALTSGMNEAVRTGKARYIGIANAYAYQVVKMNALAEKRGWAKFVSVQNHYNLIMREDEREMFAFCREDNIAMTPYSALASGKLAKRPGETSKRQKEDSFMHFKYDATAEQDNRIVQRVVELADRYGVEMTQISLAWLLTKVESPIVGATKLHHIEGAVKSLDVHLSADDIRYLEEPYMPHNLSGVMAVNKLVMSEEPVWVSASKNK